MGGGLDDKTFGMKASQILQFKNFCLKQATGSKTDIGKTAHELLNLLPKINRKLQKRISNLKISKQEKGVKIEAPNSSKTWSQCKTELGLKIISEGLCTLRGREWGTFLRGQGMNGSNQLIF